mmetsp:Transcript_31011/g.70948  ORF Transcript_31011/g.70948 Transcript_31011/m.70948 type:complete len:154 (+) Transcript_31011:1046-1507(+)
MVIIMNMSMKMTQDMDEKCHVVPSLPLHGKAVEMYGNLHHEHIWLGEKKMMIGFEEGTANTATAAAAEANFNIWGYKEESQDGTQEDVECADYVDGTYFSFAKNQFNILRRKGRSVVHKSNEMIAADMAANVMVFMFLAIVVYMTYKNCDLEL